jgi:hypothetical protein
LAKYLGEGISRKRAEEKSSALFIFLGFFPKSFSDYLLEKDRAATSNNWTFLSNFVRSASPLRRNQAPPRLDKSATCLKTQAESDMTLTPGHGPGNGSSDAMTRALL